MARYMIGFQEFEANNLKELKRRLRLEGPLKRFYRDGRIIKKQMSDGSWRMID